MEDKDLRAAFDALKAGVSAFEMAFNLRFPPVQSAPTVRVPAGANLQLALDSATGGTTILLEPQATYGAITVPSQKKLVIMTDVSLPAGRIADRAPLATLRAAGNVVTFAPGAADVLFRGVDIFTTAAKTTAVVMGTGLETALDGLPDNVHFDRCYIRADAALGGRRGIAANGKRLDVYDCVIEEFWEAYGETQAIGGWNGPGPFLIHNCRLEATGENVMFGGADSKIPGCHPSDLILTNNYLYKPDRWRSVPGSVKNIFELKHMINAKVVGNVFSGSWVSAQAGNGVLFTPRNQGGKRPDSFVKDIIFQNNVIERVSEGFGLSLQGWDDKYPITEQAANALIANNLINAKSGMSIVRGWDGLTVVDNTFAGIDSKWIGLSGQWSAGVLQPQHVIKNFVVQRNIASSGAYGIAGDNTAVGTPSLDIYSPGHLVTANMIVKSPARKIPYPVGNVLVDVFPTESMNGYGAVISASDIARVVNGR